MVPILLYHSISDEPPRRLERWTVSPSSFATQMQLLQDFGYSVVSLGEYASRLRGETATLPKRPVVLTFDDGYADFEYAVSVLDRFGYPSTLFISTGAVSSHDTSPSNGGGNPMPILTWSQLDGLRERAVELAAHSHAHVRLDELPRRLIRDQVRTSKRTLEDRLGLHVRAFAYPHGSHDRRVLTEVAAAGIEYACAVKDSFSTLHDDPLAISRLIVGPELDAAGFRQLLEGGHRRCRRHERLRTKLSRVARRTMPHRIRE